MEYNNVAAKWWADKLRNLGPGSFDNGDNSPASSFAMIFATMLATDLKPSSKAIDFFEEKLADVIKEIIETDGYLTLSVDYAPDYILSSIAQETGVSTDVFPWKTTMRIEKDKVSVSAGYAAPYKTLFPQSAE